FRRRMVVVALALVAVAVPAAAIGGSSGNPYGPSNPGQKARGYLFKNPQAVAQGKAKAARANGASSASGPKAHPHVAWGGASKTDSPSSTSDFCKYDVDFGYGADLPDYPKLGDTKDFLLVGANIYAGGFFFDRADVMWATKPAAGTITTCPAAGASGWPSATG